MKIAAVETIPIRIRRDLQAATGTAGSPTALQPSPADYRWSQTVPALYALHFETALVKVATDTGLTGWGEAQAPLAPQVACTIIDLLLAPVLVGAEFGGSPEAIEELWSSMYRTMRVRGQTGGFMLDAISGVDIALWDLAGRMTGRSVSQLLGGARTSMPAYLSGLPSGDRIETARRYWAQGVRAFKLFLDGETGALLETMDALRATLGSPAIAVDALWRLDPESAAEFGRALDDREALWLECPLPPEDAEMHGRLARLLRTPLALGESYRTRYELAPFFRERAVGVLQPDLGRCGITEGLRIARLAADHGVPVVPHVSIAMGPQIAAAIHFAAAVPNCSLIEYNPAVVSVANRFLAEPIEVSGAEYAVPRGPGLGIELGELPDSVRIPAIT